ncbi:hypothetical protein FA15DRAFT_756169 [Coprinopsis marcescibilis]|uniref:Uncharacterized protein n=1 Tax=Coprinopsis marcescibilis TaxID=230819 RepID=A0A5C3KWP3_COPMA|nr:hypothetical protein FA15DRAFT_756169 [Coprinopsis marcescibilis]
MSARLASFRGPSTPTASPAQHFLPQSPSSPSRQAESTFHRKVRTLLQELRSISESWDDLVLLDGLKSARILVDARTDLDNEITSLPDRLPKTYLVGPKLVVMEKCIASLDNVILKLEKLFRRMNIAIDNLESVLVEATKVKGWKWVREEPLWVSWPLEAFVTSIPAIIVPYHRSLHTYKQFVNRLHSHSIPFEEAKDIIEQWAQQPHLLEESWGDRWEDICAAEVERWNK